MGLPFGHADDHPVTQETNRRVWWSLFMADRWCSAGSGLPRQIHEEDPGIGLPIEEHIFQDADFGRSGSPRHARPGLWAYKISLARTFGYIQDLNREVSKGIITPDQLNARVSELASMLDKWETELPEHSRFSQSALDRYRSEGLGGTFIDMHLGFHHYAALLFFNYLDASRSRDPGTTHYPQLCKRHALEFSELLALSRATTGCEAVHATVGHMTIVSSAVLVHSLLFGEDTERASSRAGLLSNFQALLELKRFWPSMDRLVGFPAPC